MGQEIERKYTIDNVHLNDLDFGSEMRIDIEQYYLCNRKGREVRIRKKVCHIGSLRTTCYVLTVKSKGDFIREEEEDEISQSTFDMLKPFAISTIEKTRYKYGRWDVDHYRNDKWTAEIELKDEKEDFSIHVLDLPFTLIEDVTCDKRYKNAQLAKEGWPEEKKESDNE